VSEGGQKILSLDTDCAISESLLHYFTDSGTEPIVVDLRPFRDVPEKTRNKDPDYLSCAASIAAKALGRNKETLWGEYYKAQRRRSTFLGSAVIVLLGLTIALAIFMRLAQTRQAQAARSAEFADVKRQEAERSATLAADNARAEAEQRELATKSAKAEAAQRELAEQSLYAANIRVAQQALDEGNLEFADDLLDHYVTSFGDVERRGFEWYYLWRKFHREDRVIASRRLSSSMSLSKSALVAAVTSSSEQFSDKMVALWDLTSGKRLASRSTGGDVVVYSPDGRTLATVGLSEPSFNPLVCTSSE
jgi:hypothetical protein